MESRDRLNESKERERAQSKESNDSSDSLLPREISEQNIDRRRYSAGILPYAVHQGELYFLVGRDWRDEGWSDFGGKVEGCDNYNIKSTAIREFYEETVGCVQTIDNVAKWLHENREYTEIQSKTLNGSPYFMFLVEIPYLNYRHVFHKVSHFLKYTRCDTHKYFEKNDIRWVPLHVLFEHHNNKRNSKESFFQFKLRHVFKKTIDEHSHVLKRLHTHVLRKNESKDIFTYE